MANVNSTTIFIPQVSKNDLTKSQLEKLTDMAIEKFPEIADSPVFIHYQEERVKIRLCDLTDKFNNLSLEELPRINEKAPFEELEISRCWEDTYGEEEEEFCYAVTFAPKKSWIIAQLEAALEAN